MNGISFNPAKVGFSGFSVSAKKPDGEKYDLKADGNNDEVFILRSHTPGTVELAFNIKGDKPKPQEVKADSIHLSRIDKTSVLMVAAKVPVTVDTLADDAFISITHENLGADLTVNQTEGTETRICMKKGNNLTVKNPSTFNLLVAGRIQGIKDAPPQDNKLVKITTHNELNLLG